MSRFILCSKTHFDKSCWANIGTDVATNTFVVVRFHIAPDGAIRFLDPKNSILRAIDHTVVTLKSHAAGHAALALFLGLLFGISDDAFFKVAQHFVGPNMHLVAHFTRHEIKVAFEQFRVLDDLRI